MGPRVTRNAAASLFLMLALPSATAAAFDPQKRITQYIRDTWGVDDGLPVNGIVGIAQTPDGYLWLATTEEYLVRFDGVRFKVFDMRAHGAHKVASVAVDADGVLWVGTDAGLLKWQHGTTVARYDKRNGLLDDYIHCVVHDRNRTVWVCTRAGLNRLDKGRITGFTKADGLPANGVQAVLPGRDGSLWVATNGGVARLRAGAVETVTHVQAMRLHEDRAGNLWIGGFNNISRIANGRLETYGVQDGVPAAPVDGFAEDDAGSTWVAMYGGGLLRFHDGRFERVTTRDGWPSDIVMAVHMDREGSLWVGTGDSGLARLRDGPITAFGAREGLPHEMVRAVMEGRDGAIWIGTHGGGLARLLNGRFTTLTARDGLFTDAVLSLHEGPTGTIWVGTYNGGVNRIDQGRVTRIAIDPQQLPPGGFITSILEDRASALWLGTYGGGVKRLLNGQITPFRSDEVSFNTVHALAEDDDGSLWVGTLGGLSRLKNGTIERHTAGAAVWSFYRDRDKTLWVGTSAGLIRMANGHTTRYTSKEGLFHDSIFGILEDEDGRLWMSSSRGIFRVRKSDLVDVAAARRASVTSVPYGVRDGMRVAECNNITQPSAWRGRDGRLWFTTVKGAVVVDPRLAKDETRSPEVLMEEILIDGRPVAVANGTNLLSIAAGSQQVEFQYSAPGQPQPERVRFRYRMDSVDEHWVEAGARRTAYYTNLRPGRHRFRVIAASGTGSWNEQRAAVFAFDVQPFFYQTWWFYLLSVAAVAAALWRVHRFRVARVIEMERVRTRIASDLHDDIGASLSQIAVLSEVAHTVAAGDDRVAAPLERVARLSRESVDAMSDIVWAIDPHRDTPAHLATRMRRLASELLTARGIELEFDADDPDRLHLGADIRREVYLIFKEALTNIVRHARATRVHVRVSRTGRRLSIVVSDDGIGFEPRDARDGCGLQSMMRRAATVRGTLDVQSSAGRGTTVTLSVPI
jgi:ligand-binding sensor domain-containing protein/signal transduction histidine kinase